MNTEITARPATTPRGFTLIEIMVVIAIIGLLLTLVGPRVYLALTESKVTVAKANMQNKISQAIENYKRHHGRVPDSLEELLQPSDANFKEAYLDEGDILDPWTNPYKYTKLSNSKFDLMSLGGDGLEGGDAEDADIPLRASKSGG